MWSFGFAGAEGNKCEVAKTVKDAEHTAVSWPSSYKAQNYLMNMHC